MFSWLKLLSFACPAICGVVVSVVVPGAVFSQTIVKPHRILFILNGSAGMDGSWQGQASKYKLASQFITGLAEEMYGHNDDIQFALRVYGHLFPLSMNLCKDTRPEVRFSKENFYQLSLRLADIKPAGKGALDYAFTDAVTNELADTAHYQYSVIVLSDTGRQCRADNCLPPHGLGLYRKYLLEFGSATPGSCYDSVFGGEPDGFRSTIDYIISQYPAKGVPAIVQQKMPADTIRISIAVRRPAAADSATVIIYNTNQLYTLVLYKEEQGMYRRLEEIFFSGAASKTMRLKPGMYKAAFLANGVEHAQRFSVEKGSVTEVRVE